MTEQFHHFLDNFRKHPFTMFFSGLAGSGLAFLIYCCHWQLPLFSRSRILFALILAALAALGIYFFLIKITLPQFSSYNRSKRLVILILVSVASLLLNFMLDYDVPHLYPFYPSHALVLEMDLRDAPAGLNGIAFSHLQLAYRDVGYSELIIEGEFEIRPDSIFFPAGQVASISWQGITGEQAAFTFLPAAQPVSIQAAWDGQVQELGLMTSGASQPTLKQTFEVLPYETGAFRVAVFPLIALVFFILLTALFSPYPYTGVLLTVWLVVYLLYYPGIIGTVNIIAVDELMQGHPTNWHPLAYTLLTAFSIQYLATASSLLLLQIVSLALIFGSAFTFLRKRGLSQAILIPLTLLIALLPTNFLSIITLTNDIPYSIALLALTFLSFKIVISNGEWLVKPVNLLLLAVTAALAILFRYNGIPALGFFFVCLMLLYPKYWLRSGLALLLAAGAWLLVTGPLSSILNVSGETEGHFDNILLHHISAHVTNGTALMEDEAAYLNSLLPLEEWKYSCCTNTAMWLNDEFDRDAFHANSAYNRQLELSLFSRNPSLELKHMLCASDIVWNPAEGCEIQHPSLEFLRGEYFWTGSYFPQYQENSFLPKLVKPFSAFITSLEESPVLSALLWRPACYLYLALACTILLCWRFRDAHWLLLIAPLFGQSAFMLLFNRVQNFRYQYCAVLIGLLLVALAFYRARERK